VKVLVALDKFKDCLTASEACATVAQTILQLHSDWEVDICPLTDGGEGFCEILTRSAKGRLETTRVLDARFQEVRAQIGFVPKQNLPIETISLLCIPECTTTLAVVEMAQASGLQQLAPDRRDPWKASSCGTGQLLREVSMTGTGLVLLGIGGSATNDLGLGALEALGADYISTNGESITRITPAQFTEMAEIDLQSNLLPLPEIRIACDVDNPLLGPTGATATYGRQKGMLEGDFSVLEQAIANAAHLLCESTENDASKLENSGAGAAGGVGIGLQLAYGAKFIPGFQLVASWLQLGEKIREADLVLTGEGRMDESSLHGKGPWAVIQDAVSAGKPVQVYAGSLSEKALDALPEGVQAQAITPENMPIEKALMEGNQLLQTSVKNHL
jgi:glycerate kinase